MSLCVYTINLGKLILFPSPEFFFISFDWIGGNTTQEIWNIWDGNPIRPKLSSAFQAMRADKSKMLSRCDLKKKDWWMNGIELSEMKMEIGRNTRSLTPHIIVCVDVRNHRITSLLRRLIFAQVNWKLQPIFGDLRAPLISPRCFLWWHLNLEFSSR